MSLVFDPEKDSKVKTRKQRELMAVDDSREVAWIRSRTWHQYVECFDEQLSNRLYAIA